MLMNQQKTCDFISANKTRLTIWNRKMLIPCCHVLVFLSVLTSACPSRLHLSFYFLQCGKNKVENASFKDLSHRIFSYSICAPNLL